MPSTACGKTKLLALSSCPCCFERLFAITSRASTVAANDLTGSNFTAKAIALAQPALNFATR